MSDIFGSDGHHVSDDSESCSRKGGIRISCPYNGEPVTSVVNYLVPHIYYYSDCHRSHLLPAPSRLVRSPGGKVTTPPTITPDRMLTMAGILYFLTPPPTCSKTGPQASSLILLAGRHHGHALLLFLSSREGHALSHSLLLLLVAVFLLPSCHARYLAAAALLRRIGPVQPRERHGLAVRSYGAVVDQRVSSLTVDQVGVV